MSVLPFRRRTQPGQLLLSLATFETLRGSTLADHVEALRADVLQPVAEAALRLGCDVETSVETAGRRRRESTSTAKHWEALSAGLRDGTLVRAEMWGYRGYVNPSPDSAFAVLLRNEENDDPPRQEPPRANWLDISIGRSLLDALPDDWPDTIVRFVKATAPAIGARTAYITIDRSGGQSSPYERAIARGVLRSLEEVATFTRGYYWANVISEAHVRALGGAAAVARAPCAVIEDLSGSQARMFYLQLTEDIEDIPSAGLRELKRFLSPILPPGTEQTELLDDPPHLLVGDVGGEQPRREPDPQPGPAADAFDGVEATFKGEDQDPDGEVIGPLILWDHSTSSCPGEFPWMRLGEARKLAQEHGWRFTEDV